MKDVEERMAVSKALARIFAANSRTVKNWDAAWLLMNERPDDLEEYNALKKKHKFKGDLAVDKETFVAYFDELKDPKAKVEAEVEWKRYVELNAKCERLLEMQVRQARRTLTKSGKCRLARTRRQEGAVLPLIHPLTHVLTQLSTRSWTSVPRKIHPSRTPSKLTRSWRK